MYKLSFGYVTLEVLTLRLAVWICLFQFLLSMETWNLVIEYDTVQCLITKAHSFFLWMFYLFVIFV